MLRRCGKSPSEAYGTRSSSSRRSARPDRVLTAAYVPSSVLDLTTDRRDDPLVTLPVVVRRRLHNSMSLKSSRVRHYARSPVLTPVLIAGGGVAAVVVVATLTWIVRRGRVDDDQLGTISTQWIAEHRSHERDQVGH